MTATLPPDIQAVFDRFATTQYVRVDQSGRPVTRPVPSRHHRDHGCIDVAADDPDAERDHHVALLYSEPGSEAPMVLVQGTAMPEGGALHVRPERVYVWPSGDASAEPQLLDSHMEEVRSGHSEEPEGPHAPPDGGALLWDARMRDLGESDATAVLAVVGPDGFPFAVRVPVQTEAESGLVRIASEPVGVPLEPGPACLTGRGALQVGGDLVRLEDGGWALLPHTFNEAV